jgi:hypothetical protein
MSWRLAGGIYIPENHRLCCIVLDVDSLSSHHQHVIKQNKREKSAPRGKKETNHQPTFSQQTIRNLLVQHHHMKENLHFHSFKHLYSYIKSKRLFDT